MSGDELRMLMILWETREGFERRIRELEDEVSTLKNAFELLRPCDECGAVYATPEDYAAHMCAGRQS